MISAPLNSDSNEAKAAHELKDLICNAEPEVATDGSIQISILSDIQCYGQTPQDLDIVLIMHRGRNASTNLGKDTLFPSGYVVIEVKDHPADRIRFEGTNCLVEYRGEWHNASNQSRAQRFSLKNYLEENSVSRVPFIVDILWLRQVPNSQLPTQINNIAGRDINWPTLAKKIKALYQSISATSREIGLQQYFQVKKILQETITPGMLDRKKLELISKAIAQRDRQYIEKLGSQLLIFRGRGGTGKTLRLLQLANFIYTEKGLRPLLLTYNRALAQDINRLLALMRISDGVGEPGIGVRTAYQFFRQWMLGLELIDSNEEDFYGKYEALKSEFLELIRSETLSPRELGKAKSDSSAELSWDFILIDESQDWPENERDLLYLLYSHKRIVLSDGIDQFVRSHTAVDWRAPLKDLSETQVVPLRRSLRMKMALCDAINSVAEQLSVPNWNLEPEPDVFGGQIIVLSGTQYSQSQHEDILERLIDSGNKPIDMLFCVPPQHVSKDADGSRWSQIGVSLKKWGYEIWDGASDSARSRYPTSLEQHRIVQYDSSRGLEGWTVVCIGLDKFFDYKLSQCSTPEQTDLLIDLDSLQHAFASLWTMIPLTRAVDTLVVQIEDKNHPIYSVFKYTAEKFPEHVEWRGS